MPTSAGICLLIWGLCYGLGWSAWDLLPLGPLQEICTQSIADTPYQDRYAALACGEKLPRGLFLDHLQRLGIIHVFVVSGAHLSFLAVILELLRRGLFLPRASLPLALAIYCGLTGGAPPIARAFLARLLSSLNRRYKFFWLSTDRSLLAGLLCLCLHPPWIQSYSLMLSWMAALVLDFCAATRSQSRWPQPFRVSFWMYLGLSPFLLALGQPSIFSVLTNTLLAPLLCFFLFPMALLTLILPEWIVTKMDWVWTVFDGLVFRIGPLMKSQAPASTLPSYGLWIYILAVHFVIRTLVRRRQFKKNTSLDPRRLASALSS